MPDYTLSRQVGRKTHDADRFYIGAETGSLYVKLPFYLCNRQKYLCLIGKNGINAGDVSSAGNFIQVDQKTTITIDI